MATSNDALAVIYLEKAEAAVWRCSVEKVFLEMS